MKILLKSAVCLSCFVVQSGAELIAQLGGSGLNPSGSLSAGGGRFGAAPTVGLRGRGVNPNFNPAGSLSIYGRFNPQGSLGTALILNPEGSAFRPRTASALSGTTIESIAPNRDRTRRPMPSPTRAQLELMPRRSVRSWARVSLGQLAMEVEQFVNGEVWKEYLQLNELQDLLLTDTDVGLNVEDRRRVEAISQRYQKLADNTDYRAVWRLRGFQTLLTCMRHLVASDDRDRMIRSGRALNRALDAIRKDTKWKVFLEIPDNGSLDEESTGNASNTADIDQLQAVLDRFDKVDSEPAYDVIAELPEFQATRENLSALIRQLEQQQRTDSGSASQ